MVLLVAAVHFVLWATLIGNLIYLRNRRPPDDGAKARPMVSLLVPARNEAPNLAVLIPSVLAQAYESFELIVYDDDSSDDTAAVVAPYLEDDRVSYIRGSGPPDGWVGKVAALYAASRHARGDVYVFLDADAHFLHREALDSIVRGFLDSPPNTAVTALPRLGGSALLLVSLVPFTTLAALPWYLVRRVPTPLLSALNGQLWMIRRDAYHELEPHERMRAEVLEDVHIGRYLKRAGIFPRLVDMSAHLEVRMYSSFGDAWSGFRKNAYLLMGGRPIPFLVWLVLFALSTWLSPVLSFYFLLSAWAIKLVTDRAAGMPVLISLLAPLSFMLGTFLHLDSALAHGRRTVSWKGRNVSGG